MKKPQRIREESMENPQRISEGSFKNPRSCLGIFQESVKNPWRIHEKSSKNPLRNLKESQKNPSRIFDYVWKSFKNPWRIPQESLKNPRFERVRILGDSRRIPGGFPEDSWDCGIPGFPWKNPRGRSAAQMEHLKGGGVRAGGSRREEK